jgi:hypothetical protein
MYATPPPTRTTPIKNTGDVRNENIPPRPDATAPAAPATFLTPPPRAPNRLLNVPVTPLTKPALASPTAPKIPDLPANPRKKNAIFVFSFYSVLYLF